MEIMSVVNGTMETCVEKLKEQGIEPSDIVAVGVTNQRESTIAWDKYTGKPLYNSIGNGSLIDLTNSIRSSRGLITWDLLVHVDRYRMMCIWNSRKWRYRN